MPTRTAGNYKQPLAARGNERLDTDLAGAIATATGTPAPAATTASSVEDLLVPGFRVEQSQVAPWFQQPGGGIQYRIVGPDGNNASVNDLLDSGYLKDLHE